jgi:hypothetical protein
MSKPMPAFTITEQERKELLTMEEDIGTTNYLGMRLHDEVFKLAERAGLNVTEASDFSDLVGLAACRIDNLS